MLPITLRPEVDFAEATKTVFIPRYVSVREYVAYTFFSAMFFVWLLNLSGCKPVGACDVFVPVSRFVHMMGPLLSKRPSEVPDSARTAAVKSLCELLTDISNFIYVAFLGAPVLRQLWNVGNPTLASSSSSPSPLSRFSDSNRCAVVAAMCLAAWRVRLAPHFHTHVLGICCAECGNVLNDANMIVYPRVGNPFSPVMFQSLPGRLSGAPHPPETACDVYCTR